MTLEPFEKFLDSKPELDLEPEKVPVPVPIKSVMTCPLCKSQAIEIVSRCATCKACGWSICNA
jgi:hypothetical protein